MKNMRIEMAGSVAKDVPAEGARAYSKPELKQLGSVVALTRSGTASGNEHSGLKGSCVSGTNTAFRSCN